jgi:ABC-2 type transport system ATP-binding protein
MLVGMPRVVSAVELTKRFGEITAVSDLSFDLDAGSVTGFLGPNGAGKTTTLRMLLGLAEPTRGRALVFGRRFAELERPATRVGAVLEASDLHPGRTGRDHLRVFAPVVRAAASRVEEMLALVDLKGAAGRRVEGYSLGMRQRLGLAAALLGDPELLILDEPANGLDPEGVRWLRDFLRAFAAQGKTVFVSSHHLAEVEQLVDQVVIINHGRLVVESTLTDLTARLAGTVRVQTARVDALEAALRNAGVDATERENGALRVHGVTAERIGRIALAADVELSELVTESSSLEDVFFELTAGPRP